LQETARNTLVLAAKYSVEFSRPAADTMYPRADGQYLRANMRLRREFVVFRVIFST